MSKIRILSMAAVISEGRKFKEVANMGTEIGQAEAGNESMNCLDDLLLAQAALNPQIEAVMVINYATMSHYETKYISVFAVGIRYTN